MAWGEVVHPLWVTVTTAASEAVAIPSPPVAKHEEAGFPAPRDEPKLGASTDLLLGAGAEFEGKLTFKGTVRIDARFKGSIVTNDVLVVGEHALIDAEITCGTVVVDGEVNGNIKAKSAVELHKSAKVRGNVETNSLTVEKGAFLQGEMKMGPAEKKGGASLQ